MLAMIVLFKRLSSDHREGWVIGISVDMLCSQNITIVPFGAHTSYLTFVLLTLSPLSGLILNS